MRYRFGNQPITIVGVVAVVLGMLLAPAAAWTRLFSAATDSAIYADSLAAGWQDWSWDTTRNAANTQPVHSGSHSYAVDHTAAWGGFYLRAEPAINTTGFTHLRFWLHGGATGGQQIRILLNEDDTKIKLVTATVNAWTQVDIPLADLGSPATLFAIYWQDVNGGAQAVYYLDDISLVGAAQPPPADVTIQLDDTAAGTTIDPRIRGTNMAAWSKPLLTTPTFIARTKASGVSVIRIPGGSWSNGYGWLSCEMGQHVANAEKCRAPDRQGGYFDIFWAATPTNWIDFLQAVEIEGMYVVNPNGTPQEAAAAVAFFNAAVGDATVIGVDARGKDWLTAGHWAQLRADRGNPAPLGIKLWAVGNEVYAGTQCVENGWEPIWTCEGTEYVNGATVNNIQQGGYLAFRTAMRAVDPTILVGAVGDSPGTSYGNWGNEVVSAAAAVMDFYDVHAYAYWDIPANNQILSHPHSFWPAVMTGVQQTFAQHANGRTIPVALTEYNLGLEFKDTNLQMTRAVNGLFMADSVGQLITSGYTMANQFLLASGDQPETGTDFGLLRPDHNWQRSPQYFAYHLWSKVGDRLLPVSSSAAAATELSVYAGRRDANTLTLLVINKQNTDMTAAIDLKSGSTMTGGMADVAQATTLDAQTVRFNGMAESNLANDLSNAPATTLTINSAVFNYTFAPYSLTLLQLSVDGADAPTATHTPTATPTTAGPTPTATATAIASLTPLPPADIDLRVDLNAERKAISEFIYGLHYVADEAFVQEIGLPLRRWGGNNTTRYNWELGATNHASDWYFHNNTTYDAITGTPMTADQWLQRNKRTNTASLLTIPMIGYVAKGGDQRTCSFPASLYPNQDDFNNEDGFPECGNGLRNGTPIQADPLTTSRAVDETFVQGWIEHLQSNAATNGAVTLFNLDNEPDIWFETHRDVYPVGWKYDEFRDLTYRYAAAIKATNPNAKLLGPVVNGWTYYWHGSWDGQREDWTTPDDRDAHGGLPFVPWYLQQMKAYEDQQGVRLLDYLDLHYYPQSNGVSLSPAGDAATQALRLRSTRSLWDPTYVDESWIADAGPEGGIIQLIPRMKAWVDQYYPGTKLAITEYNWGGLESINGALAQADVLGIFGREGLDLATFFDPGQGNPLQTTFPSSPAAYAFRLYRNYDGQGGRFGETSLQATSSDQGKLAIYAAQRDSDSALTLIVINKTDAALTANLVIANPTRARHAVATAVQRYQYSSANLNAIQHLPDVELGDNALHLTLPANSITLLQAPTILSTPGGPPRFPGKLYLPMVDR